MALGGFPAHSSIAGSSLAGLNSQLCAVDLVVSWPAMSAPSPGWALQRGSDLMGFGHIPYLQSAPFSETLHLS